MSGGISDPRGINLVWEAPPQHPARSVHIRSGPDAGRCAGGGVKECERGRAANMPKENTLKRTPLKRKRRAGAGWRPTRACAARTQGRRDPGGGRENNGPARGQPPRVRAPGALGAPAGWGEGERVGAGPAPRDWWAGGARGRGESPTPRHQFACLEYIAGGAGRAAGRSRAGGPGVAVRGPRGAHDGPTHGRTREAGAPVKQKNRPSPMNQPVPRCRCEFSGGAEGGCGVGGDGRASCDGDASPGGVGTQHNAIWRITGRVRGPRALASGTGAPALRGGVRVVGGAEGGRIRTTAVERGGGAKNTAQRLQLCHRRASAGGVEGVVVLQDLGGATERPPVESRRPRRARGVLATPSWPRSAPQSTIEDGPRGGRRRGRVDSRSK